MGPSESKSHITTRVMGTSGYAAPEYVSTGHLYDAYGFGVVLAEMMTALHAMDPTRPSGRENLVDWIKPYLYDRRKLKTIMDSCLEGTYSSKDALRIAQLALKCIAVKQKGRSAMEEVVETLELLQAGNENVTVIRKAPRRTAPTSQAMPRPRTD